MCFMLVCDSFLVWIEEHGMEAAASDVVDRVGSVASSVVWVDATGIPPSASNSFQTFYFKFIRLEI